MPELNQLHQLVTIAETGTISKAAEIIHISQPALTRSMQKLETEWNVTLFDRSVVPFLDPEASITFYCCVKKSNRALLPLSAGSLWWWHDPHR